MHYESVFSTMWKSWYCSIAFQFVMLAMGSIVDWVYAIMLMVDCASQCVLWVGGWGYIHRKSIKNSSADIEVDGQGVTDVTAWTWKCVLWVCVCAENPSETAARTLKLVAKVLQMLQPVLDSVCSGCVYVQKIHQKLQLGRWSWWPRCYRCWPTWWTQDLKWVLQAVRERGILKCIRAE